MSEELKTIEEEAKIETIKELKKRKAVAIGKEKAVAQVSKEQKNEAKKLRIEQLLGLGREELVSYSKKLGFKRIQDKSEDKKRETKDIAHLLYHKEMELGGKDNAAAVVMNEVARVEALKQQREKKSEQKGKAESAQIRQLREELEELKKEIHKIKK
tara:strand:+ start:536 stop:1006 length:471 start_codon:yes stop_codon:yes gene_type:complete